MRLDTILPIGSGREFRVEDACRAHLAEWRGRKVGTWDGLAASAFASKNLNSGEGGAILCNDEDLFERCYRFHNNGSGLKRIPNRSYDSNGTNVRMPEFQAALLTAQMARIEAQAATRTSNATYLTSMLNQITGIAAARMYDGCTRNAYHLYMFRYDKSRFADLPRSAFLKRLRRRCPGERQLPHHSTRNHSSRSIERARVQEALSGEDSSEWHERNRCPVNDRVCEEAVWFSQYILLAPRKSMELIADAIRKIQASADRLPRT
jgi:dTDP-4-amino-4,6-dideoxygalactose transaminase